MTQFLYSGGEAIGGGMIAYSNSIGPISFGVGMGNGGTGDLQLMKHHMVYLTHLL